MTNKKVGASAFGGLRLPFRVKQDGNKIMNKRRTIRIILISVIILIQFQPLLADAPYEKYHLFYQEISKDVLRKTIGILTISSGIKKGTELKTYSKSGNKYIFDKIIKPKETIPISNFGYHPSFHEPYIENYRYPIVFRSDPFLCIVYDPKKNLKTWVNLEEVGRDFYILRVFLDSLSISEDLFVDVFYFTGSVKRKVYKEPENGADFSVISEDEHKYSAFKVIEQKDGFIKIGIFRWDADPLKEEPVEPIGWIKIRDDKGYVTVWVKYISFD
jgi:hypothetical protein